MSGDGDVTLGEVYRALLEHKKDTRSGFEQVNRRISGLKVVHRDTYEADQDADRGRIKVLEDRSRFIARTLSASVLTLLATLIGNGIYVAGHIGR